ncbi:MAG: dihydrofolate reductase family protein [Caldilineaceae bacterium]
MTRSGSPAQPTPEQRQRLNRAQILELPTTAQGQVDLDALFAELGRRGVQSVMVEGGAQIITSLWQQKLAHVAVITIAPILLGGLHSVRTPLYSANGNGLHFPACTARRPSAPVKTPSSGDPSANDCAPTIALLHRAQFRRSAQ